MILWPNIYKEMQTTGIQIIVNLWPNVYKETQTTGIHVFERHKEEEQGEEQKLKFWI